MKNLILLTGLVMILMTSAYSQTNDKTITLQKKKYYQNGQKLTSKEMKTILTGNPASAEEFQMYKKNVTIGGTLVIAGSACLLAGSVISLASSIQQTKDINNGDLSGESSTSGLGLVLVGCIVDLVSIPFLIPAYKHYKNAINNYNSSLQKTSYRPVQLKMRVASNRIGVRINF